MRTQTQVGNVLDLTAPYDCINTAAYAAGFKIGSIVGVAAETALNGAGLTGIVDGWCGVVAKATGAAWTVGVLLYWDDTAKNFTTVSTSNTKCGYATLAAATGDTVGTLRLEPCL